MATDQTPRSVDFPLIAAETQCQHLMARQTELEAEVEGKAAAIVGLEADLKAVRMTAAETQVAFDKLTRRIIDDEGEKSTGEAGTSTSRVEEDLEVMRARSRKYPELKAIAFELKERLVRRAELLSASMRETRRLKRLVVENERRARGFLEELERMRQQILAKNATIKKLETVVLGTCQASVCVSSSFPPLSFKLFSL